MRNANHNSRCVWRISPNCDYICWSAFHWALIAKIVWRKEKSGRSLFICLTVRTVHINVVPKSNTVICLIVKIPFFCTKRQIKNMIIDKRSRFFRPEIEFEENVAATGTKEEWKNIQLKNRTKRSSLHQAECKSKRTIVGCCKKAATVVLESVSVPRDVLAEKISVN